MNISDKITIITTLLPDIGRDNAIKRFITYHKRVSCKIIIVTPNKNNLLNLDYENIDILECHKDADVFSKISQAANIVTTPYISYVADDDFIGLDFIKESIELLEKDDTFVACDALSVFLDEKNVRRVNSLYTFENYKNGLNVKKAICNDFIFQAHNFNPMVIHGVIRTNVFSEAINCHKNFSTQKPIRWMDNIIVAKILTKGKIAFLKNIAGIRSYDTRIVDHNPDFFNKTSIPKKELIMDDEILNFYTNVYKEQELLTAEVKASILYYFIISSNVLKLNQSDKKAFKRLYISFLSFVEFILLNFLNKQIRYDMKLIKKLMKQYPILIKNN